MGSVIERSGVGHRLRFERECPANCVDLVVWLRLMRTLVGRAVVEGRTMLMEIDRMHARSLRSCNRKRWAQADNHCERDCDSQFHIASISVDKTREHDARIHENVVS